MITFTQILDAPAHELLSARPCLHGRITSLILAASNIWQAIVATQV